MQVFKFLVGSSIVAMTTMGLGATAAAQEAPQPTAGQEDSPTDIVVTGVRESIRSAQAIKRDADQVVDSVQAQDIGKLPDANTTEALQRIPGVQIRREAGEGGAINIRGLPQVATLMNGEQFLGANSITNVQPNFTDIPSQLFAGADVVKSVTGNMLNAGITGTVNLRTRRPFDLRQGLTVAAAVEGAYGDQTKKFSPQANGLIAWHGDGFGALLSASYSNVDLYNAYTGIQRDYGGKLHNESLADAGAGDGFHGNSDRGTAVYSGGNLVGYDVNGDGDANDTFFVPQAWNGWQRITSRERLGINGSFQAEISDALTFTADGFYTKQTQYDRTAGFQFQSVNWQGAEFVPGHSTDTGVNIGGYDFNTIDVYNYDLPNFDSYSETIRTESESKNFNAELTWDNHSGFKATLRGIYADANQDQNQSYLQFNLSNGLQWHGGVGHYPASLGGDRVFNAGGYTVDTVAGANALPATIDFSGSNLNFTLPGQLTTELGDINSYALKTLSSENNYRRNADLKVIRADASYEFSDKLNVEFGARYSDRSTTDFEFERAAPLYGGNGATNAAGCLVKWKAFDVIMNDSSCSAGDANGFFTAGLTRKANDPSFNNGVKQFDLPVGGVGPIYVLDPKLMDDAVAFQNSFYPGNVEVLIPGRSFDVGVQQISGYFQINGESEIGGLPIHANAGVRVINTRLHVRQNQTGAGRAYGVSALDVGDIVTDREFTDYLPAFNLSLDFTQKLRLRFAYTKTMTLLDLNQWGGGFDLNYAIDTTDPNNPIFRVGGGNSNGNPNLDPWRADNLDLSLEWYLGRSSLLSLAAFHVDVASFIENGTVVRTDIPDLDGVVRGRPVTINTPLQGKGGTLQGIEAGAKLAFNDLGVGGFFGNFGVDANLTYSPSDSGRTDLAGNDIPFQDNSKIQTNAAVYYEDRNFQVRVAWNYRSKRAVSADYGGVSGLEVYQEPTNYVDASVAWNVNDHFTIYGQGSNLTGESEKYYLTFPDLRAYNNLYERRFVAGVRAKF